MSKIDFTILMPCLDEAETIKNCITKAKKWIYKSGYKCEILVADNGSNDNSIQIAKSLGAKVIHVKHKGYGNAIYYGVLNAKGNSIIVADADDSYDFSKLDNFSSKLNEGYDFVIGNRFLGGIAPGAMPWKNRYIGNPILSLIGRFLFSIKVRDFHCGIRGFTKKAFLKMDLRTTGMEFASEMVIKASIFGCRICEVPTTLSKDGRSRAPHLRPWKDGWRHLRFMLLFSPSWLFLYPGIFFSLLFMPIYMLLYISPLKVLDIKFDIHTMVYLQTAIILSFLMILFGIQIRVYSIREGLMRSNSFYNLFKLNFVPEIGLLIGLATFLFGLTSSFEAFAYWKNLNFEDINDANHILRWVSLSSLSMELGGIFFLFSLIFGYIQIPTRRI
jgi:glycosyltransferase involved in cell wall biosynthesis